MLFLFFQFLTMGGGEEKVRLIPVLTTILKLSPAEVQLVQKAINGELHLRFEKRILFVMSSWTALLGILFSPSLNKYLFLSFQWKWRARHRKKLDGPIISGSGHSNEKNVWQ